MSTIAITIAHTEDYYYQIKHLSNCKANTGNTLKSGKFCTNKQQKMWRSGLVLCVKSSRQTSVRCSLLWLTVGLLQMWSNAYLNLHCNQFLSSVVSLCVCLVCVRAEIKAHTHAVQDPSVRLQSALGSWTCLYSWRGKHLNTTFDLRDQTTHWTLALRNRVLLT